MGKKKEIKIAIVGHHPIGSTTLTKELEKRGMDVTVLSGDQPAREAEGIMINGELYNFVKDVPELIREITNNHHMGVMRIPLSVLQSKLIQIASRASELDDPELNVLMLETKLCEIEHNKIQEEIEKQKNRIKK